MTILPRTRRITLVLACVAGVAAGSSEPGLAEQRPGGGGCPEQLPVLLSRPFAESSGLAVGDSLRLSTRSDAAGCAGRVSGVYRLPPDPYRLTEDRPRVLLHLPHLTDLADRKGEVDRFTVALRPGASAAAVAPTLEALLPGTRALETEEVAARTSTTFRVVERFHRAIAVITVAAGGVFLACIMVLKVQERRREVAALRLIGISRETLLGWLMAEAALVALLGGGLGLAIARGASWVINTHYRDVYDTSVAFSTLTPETVAIGLALAVVLGLVAGGVAALRLLTLHPLEEVGG